MTQESCGASVTNTSGCSNTRLFPLTLKYEGRKPLVQRSIGKDLDTDSAEDLIAISNLYVPLARGIQPEWRVTSKKDGFGKFEADATSRKARGRTKDAE